ncbi:transglycosylase domain-containing protein [Streptomyces sp. NPDC057413]|uniref:transglycosylase domain-containing protein n=1 Tax=Streptomyces sp. NPDC057413 TaxID=3346124 RepID=UPI0036BC7483
MQLAKADLTGDGARGSQSRSVGRAAGGAVPASGDTDDTAAAHPAASGPAASGPAAARSSRAARAAKAAGAGAAASASAAGAAAGSTASAGTQGAGAGAASAAGATAGAPVAGSGAGATAAGGAQAAGAGAASAVGATAAARAARAARAAQAAQAAQAAGGGTASAGGPAGAAAGATAAAGTAAGAARVAQASGGGDVPTAHASDAPAGGGGGGKKGKRPKRTGWRRLVPTWRMLLGTLVLGIVVIAGLFLLGYSMVKIPSANAMATKQSNVYFYADGTEIARDGEINRENVSLAQVSKAAQHAVLAAEDRDFYSESAVDPKAMIRAGWNTATGKGKQSGSTITQQYVKNYYLGQEQTVTRKVKEFFIAIKLDREKSKDQILEGYLNTSFFGRNAYGIQAAARAYYGIDAVDLNAAQGAYLASLLNAPSEYDIVAHPENRRAAEARWNYVLDGMVKKGWLSQADRAKAKFPAPKEETRSTGMSGQRGYIVDAIKDYLRENKILDPDDLERGGYRITTTLQKAKQDAFVEAVNDKLISKLDKKNNPRDRYVRAGGASVDPKTGKVVAMYGGIDYVKQYTNGATRGDFQVGSTFKPFVFTSAVENGATTQDGRPITPNTIYDGTNKRPVQGWDGEPYSPENEDQVSYGPITVREATDKSVNAVYAQMAVDAGPAKVKQTAIDLGLPADTKELYASPSIALGVANASVLDMAEAYATLANHGRHGTYTLIEKITKGGETVPLPARTTRQAVSREAADTTTAILQSVVENGTATAAQAAGRPAAGKTGTAEEDTAAWFAGYTPDLATVVSVMGQDPDTAAHKSLRGALGLNRINGGGAPTEIWAKYTKDALENTPVSDFDLELQDGADVSQAPPSTDPSQQQPGTVGGDDGGSTGDTTGTAPATRGQTQGQTQGQTGTPTTGGTTTGGTTGGTPTTGGGGTGTTGGSGTTGTTTGGGSGTGGSGTTGDTTGGGTTGGGGTDGGAGGTPGGGTSDGGTFP